MDKQIEQIREWAGIKRDDEGHRLTILLDRIDEQAGRIARQERDAVEARRLLRECCETQDGIIAELNAERDRAERLEEENRRLKEDLELCEQDESVLRDAIITHKRGMKNYECPRAIDLIMWGALAESTLGRAIDAQLANEEARDLEDMAEPTVDEKYRELIMAVAEKFPGESRHETALRYIRQQENPIELARQYPVKGGVVAPERSSWFDFPGQENPDEN